MVVHFQDQVSLPMSVCGDASGQYFYHQVHLYLLFVHCGPLVDPETLHSMLRHTNLENPPSLPLLRHAMHANQSDFPSPTEKTPGGKQTHEKKRKRAPTGPNGIGGEDDSDSNSSN